LISLFALAGALRHSNCAYDELNEEHNTSNDNDE